jgi:hypothetical protein
MKKLIKRILREQITGGFARQIKKIGSQPPTKTCNFILPLAWPTYEPKLEKGAGDFEIWGARIYAALMSGDFESTGTEGTYGKLGHGGLALIHSSGLVGFFEFGRYAGAKEGMGITLKKKVNIKAKFGTEDGECIITNLTAVVNAIKQVSYGEGPRLEMDGYVVPIPNIRGAYNFAKRNIQREYQAIDLEIGDENFNCGTFIYDVAKAGGIDMGNWCFPDPASVVDSFESKSVQEFSA